MRRLFHRKATSLVRDPSTTGKPVAITGGKTFPSGLKLMHDAQDSVVDIIFVHGLTGDRETTWTAEGCTAPWLQTYLPSEVINARILTFGYSIHVQSNAGLGDSVYNRSRALLEAIATYRERDETNNRPIIFVCHCIGGLVCEDALVAAQQSREDDRRAIYNTTRGILFLGTPHSGSPIVKWSRKIVKRTGVSHQTLPSLLELLKPEAEVLAQIQARFHSLLRIRGTEGLQPINITCFYEELPLPGIGVAVPSHSAILHGYNYIGIHSDHVEMTKFQDNEDPGFISVSGELRRWVKHVTTGSTEFVKNTVLSRALIRDGDHMDVPNRDMLPYKRIKALGVGGSAVVELVQDTGNGREFAHKSFNRYHGTDVQRHREAIQNEVRIMRRLASHPHIIHVFATYTCHRDFGMFLTPVADGGDLANCLQNILDTRRGPTTNQRLVLERAFGCLACGLEFIHQHTIRHKDIKPQNILIHQGRVVYTDFGIAHDATQHNDNTTTVGKPQEYTPRYCAPEVADWAERNRKSDVFSLGCVYLEILAALERDSGFANLRGMDYWANIDEVRSALHKAKQVCSHRSELIHIVLGMLETKPEDRPSAAELRAQLALLQSSSSFECFCGTCAPSRNRVTQDNTGNVVTTVSRQAGLGLAQKGSFFVPYTRNPAFVGRTRLLDKLKDHFASNPRAALYGLGGIGKTQIALTYAYWVHEASPDTPVFWVHASNPERFRQAYSHIAESCQIPGHDDAKADTLLLVKNWLEKKEKRPWLMIIDNADDANMFFTSEAASATRDGVTERSLNRYIPECSQGTLLITTRNKQAGVKLTKNQFLINVARMDETESHQLICKKLEDDTLTIEQASALADALENLPLAMVQAAAFIRVQCLTVSRYLQLLGQSDRALVKLLSEPFEEDGRDSSVPNAVAATWIVSFEQIRHQYSEATDMLSLMSLFDRQEIPFVFVEHYWKYVQYRQRGRSELEDMKEKDRLEKSEAEPTCDSEGNRGHDNDDDEDRILQDLELEKVLGVLRGFSFVTQGRDHEDLGKGDFSMHRLVRLVIHRWLKQDNQFLRWASRALLIVEGLYPFGEHETREVCKAYLPHAYAVLEYKGLESSEDEKARARLLHNAAGLMDYQGNYKAAEEMLAQAVEIQKRVLGEEDLGTLASMNNLASTCRNQRRWSEAEKLQVQVLEATRRVRGEEHAYTLKSMGNLASTYKRQGRLQEAKELEVQVLETRRRVLGEEHPDTMLSMNNLAHTLKTQGRKEEAIPLMRRCIELQGKVLGVEHPDAKSSLEVLVLWEAEGIWGRCDLEDPGVRRLHEFWVIWEDCNYRQELVDEKCKRRWNWDTAEGDRRWDELVDFCCSMKRASGDEMELTATATAKGGGAEHVGEDE